MANSFDHLISENEDNVNPGLIAISNLDNIWSGQNDYIANSTQQPPQSSRKLSAIAPEPSLSSLFASSSPIFEAASKLPSIAVKFPSSTNTMARAPSMSSNSENQEFKFSAAASNFTPSSQSRDCGPSNGFYAPATRNFTTGQEALPMTSFQGQSSRTRPTSYFQTREYHEGHLRDNGKTRADSSPPVVSSSLYRPQHSLPASNQNHPSPSSEIQTLLPLQGPGLHADLLECQPLLPALTQDRVLSHADDVQSSSSQTGLQMLKFTCKNCKWPSTFDDVEYVLPLPARPTPSQAWLHHQSSGLPYSYLGHFQSGLAAGNDDNTEVDHAESSFPPVNQNDLVSADVREKIDFVTRTNGTAGHTPDDIVARAGLQHEPGPALTNSPAYHSELDHRQMHKIALSEILKRAANDREFLRNRIKNIQQWWEHALVDEVDRLQRQLNEALAESEERKTQLSAAQEEIKKLKEAEVSNGLEKVNELESTEKRSSECKVQERQVRCLDMQATEMGEEDDKLQTENDQLQAQNAKLRNENANLQERLNQTMKGAFGALQTRNKADNTEDELPTLLTTRGRRLIRSGQVTSSSSSSPQSANFSLSR